MYYFLNYFNENFDVFFLSAGLFLLVFCASNLKKYDKKMVLVITGTILLLSILEYLEVLVSDRNGVLEENLVRYILSIICYMLRPVIIVLFFYIRLGGYKPKEKFIFWIPAIINSLIYIFAIFAYKNPNMRLIFWYDENNAFGRTWVGLSVYAVCILYMISFISMSFIDSIKRKDKFQINFIIIISSIIAVCALLITAYFRLSVSYVSDAFLIGLLFYYMYLTYEAAYKDAVQNERKMQENTTALMLSQIQPHFIYNTLATIQVLCDIDPELAAKTIDDFSKYLRVNTDALSKTEPVNILDEVKHAKAYASIEMTRFDNVHVLFEIEDQEFNVPVLTIQPMVENAIKYGVRGLEYGEVVVKTYKKNNRHYLIIKDNGKGFEVEKLYTDGRNHVGVKNVKTRIINMSKGTFTIESQLGKGTTVTIEIPEV